MVLTRQQSIDAFNHVIDVVLHRPNTLRPALANEGISEIFALLTIDDATISGLQYEETVSGAVVTRNVNKGDKQLIRVFRDFVVVAIPRAPPLEINGQPLQLMNLMISDVILHILQLILHH